MLMGTPFSAFCALAQCAVALIMLCSVTWASFSGLQALLFVEDWAVIHTHNMWGATCLLAMSSLGFVADFGRSGRPRNNEWFGLIVAMASGLCAIFATGLVLISAHAVYGRGGERDLIYYKVLQFEAYFGVLAFAHAVLSIGGVLNEFCCRDDGTTANAADSAPSRSTVVPISTVSKPVKTAF